MAYIGSEPITGNFIYADDITASATNTYNILVGGVAFSPESANHLIVSLNGVIQKANTSFSVSGSQITFLPSSGTLSSSDSIDFILILGRVNDIGVASSVTDSSITKGKLNLISDSSSAGLTVKGDGSSENGTLQLNCSQNSHGIKLSSPSHASGQSYELIFPTGNVTADKVLKVASVSGSGATGIGQLSFGDAGGGLEEVDVWRYTTQSSSAASYLTANLERDDTTGATYIGTGMSESSGVFTFPSTGKYLIKANGTFYNDTGAEYYASIQIYVTTDGTNYGTTSYSQTNSMNTSGTTAYMNSNALFLFDVTNTSTHKVKFYWNRSGHAKIIGTSGANQTYFVFQKLGAT